MNNLQNLLLFPLKDTESRNRLLVASALSFAGYLIPVLPWIWVMGYAGEVMRRVIQKEEAQMPEWNWGEYFPLGAKLFGVNFIYSLPIMFPMFLGYFMMIIPAILIDSEVSSSGEIIPAEWALIGMFGGMALFGIGMLFSIVLCVILPPALSHAAAQNSFSAGFHVREWWQVFKANIGGFILSIIVTGGLYMVIMLGIQILYMTLILCFLVPFLMAAAMSYWSIVTAALFGQAYRDGLEKISTA